MAVVNFEWSVDFSSPQDAKDFESFVKTIDPQARITSKDGKNISVSFKGELDVRRLSEDLNPVIKEVVTQALVRSEAKTHISKLLEDKKVETTDKFSGKSSKTAGISAGYVAKRNTDKHTFLIKQAFKAIDALDKEIERLEREDEWYDNKEFDLVRNMDLSMEYLMGPLYQRILYDRAPVIEMVLEKGDQATKVGLETLNVSGGQDIYIRSKFLDNFQMLGNYSGDPEPTGTEMKRGAQARDKLSKVEGFEKVIAASLFMGEIDYHSGNIGVVTKEDDNGIVHNIAVKIDHGKSFVRNNFVSNLYIEFVKDYDRMGYGDMPFDSKTFKDAINQMCQITDDEIENIITKRVMDLFKQGFEFQDAYANEVDYYTFTTENIDRIKQNRAVMQEFAKVIEMIELSDHPDSKNCIVVLQKIGSLDPAKYLVSQGYKVEGKNPVEWLKDAKFVDSPDIHAAIEQQTEILTSDKKGVGKFTSDVIKSTTDKIKPIKQDSKLASREDKKRSHSVTDGHTL